VNNSLQLLFGEMLLAKVQVNDKKSAENWQPVRSVVLMKFLHSSQVCMRDITLPSVQTQPLLPASYVPPANTQSDRLQALDAPSKLVSQAHALGLDPVIEALLWQVVQPSDPAAEHVRQRASQAAHESAVP